MEASLEVSRPGVGWLHRAQPTQPAAGEAGGDECPGINDPHARTIVARGLATLFMALRVSTISGACSAIQGQS